VSTPAPIYNYQPGPAGVVAAAPAMITSAVSLDDAKAYLNMTTPVDDVELQRVVDAATSRLEQEVGPMSVRTVTETFSQSNRGWIQLGNSPVVDVLTAVADGLAITPRYINLSTGAMYVGPLYLRLLTVTYTCGWLVLPPDIQHALLVFIKHLWDTQRAATPGGARSGLLGTPTDAPNPGVSYSLPNRVLEMIQPYRHLGSFA
jgi:hypothetical protein